MRSSAINSVFGWVPCEFILPKFDVPAEATDGWAYSDYVNCWPAAHAIEFADGAGVEAMCALSITG